MSSGQFPNLFTPLQIKDVIIRNRILSTGHGTFMHGGNPDDEDLRAYFTERSKGGCGLIEVECSTIDRRCGPLLPLWDKKFIPGYQKLTDSVHEYGAKIFQQVGHLGRFAMPGIRYSMAATSTPCRTWDFSHVAPKRMEIEDIKWLVEAYGRGAAISREGGFDGVTIHSSYMDYMLTGFISTFSNDRTDEYGGSLENRLRIVFEVIDSFRRHVGDDFVVGMQINGDDYTPGGLDPATWREIARRIDETGKIDYIIVKGGTYWTPELNIPDWQFPLGIYVNNAAAIRQEVENALVFANARINDPAQAEKILANGQADMVGMTRAQICDPELANKAREGRVDDIRMCIACNEGCAMKIYGGFTCMQNPAAYHERKLGIGTLEPALLKKNVMIVGGGPAGLKVAEVAARRGHKVTLYEKRDQLGGQVNIAAKASGRDEFAGATRYLALQVQKLGVVTHLSTEVTREMVFNADPDAVVVATGSSPTRISKCGIPWFDPAVPEPVGCDQTHVLTTFDILEKELPVGQRVIVAEDGDGFWKSITVAETLLDRGATVEFVTPEDHMGFYLQLIARKPALERILKKGLTITPHSRIREIKEKRVSLYNIYSRKEWTVEDIDTVVLAYYNKADEDLYFALKNKVKELHRIGDCLAPRLCGDAIREGEILGREL